MLHRVAWYCYELWRNQWLRPADLVKLQEKRLREIVHHSYDNVPLYKEKLDASGVKPGDIRSLADLQKLPFTTKQEIREGIPDRSIARGFGKGNCIRASTSGTSGGRMPVYYDKRFWDYCMAAWVFRKQWAIGVEPWQKVLIVTYGGPIDHHQNGGEEAAPPKTESRGYVSLGPAVRLIRDRRRTVTIASDADRILTEILSFRPKLIRGSPSYLRLLAEAMDERGVEGLADTVLRTEGELADYETRRYLETSFNCDVYDEYSSWDCGNGAWECTRKEGYHIDADMLIMEVMKGNEQASPGERGEIVVTNLLNYAMPLIRYKIGDIGALDDRACPCGRGLPLLKSVEGRKADCLALSNGRLVTPRTIMTAIQGTPGVSRYQVVQEGSNKVRIVLMRRNLDPEISMRDLSARCQEALGADVEIEVTNAGRNDLKAKYRPVISKL